MLKKRRQKLMWVLFFVALLSIVVGLVLYALRQNISLFYSPSQLVSQTISAQRMIRVGGMVVPHSVVREADGLTVRFAITDYVRQVTVRYRGVLPDLFREGQGVVVKGRLLDADSVLASEVLAKHDEKYMPPEVKSILKTEKVSG